MEPAKSFRDLRVYQAAREASLSGFELSKDFPLEERYSFEDLDGRYDAIAGMLSRMIDRADDFCKHTPATDYRDIAREEGEPPFADH